MPSSTPEKPWRKWYSTKRWFNRRRYQLRKSPLCVTCEKNGVVTAANVADHVVPHRGDPALFWFGELQSLCTQCHQGRKQQVENKGYVSDIGNDGWPVDPRHPANKQGGP
ncbi:MAG: HNH endonuclease [Anaerolineales bacterium]